MQGRIKGENGSEVSQVASTLLKEAMKAAMKVNISNSTIGMLNAGDIENVESISIQVSSLADAGHEDVAEALKHLTQSVTENREISGAERTELLDQLGELSRQATLPPEKRMKAGVIKSFLTGLGGALSAAGGSAEVWATWGPTIRAFFSH